MNFQQQTAEMLNKIAARLEKTSLPKELAEEIRRLAGAVESPCVVAVVGQVKAGKSTFINALLGEDLAKTGTTETTATINYFRYGETNSENSVRCHWRGGNVTDANREFLDSLQGNDVETLRRADGIDYLEYFLPIPLLRQVTLVDTPGTGAVVDEHQIRTAEHLNLARQLRERHHQETRRIGSEADAVIYLIGEVARTSDRDFLEEFTNVTGGQSRAFNAVGVMAKIDLNPEVLKRRRQLVEKLAVQLKDNLNSVVPVSAGIGRMLDLLSENDAQDFKRLLAALSRIAPPTLDLLLRDEKIFLEYAKLPDCSVEERRQLRRLGGNAHWGVFTTLVRMAIEHSFDVEAVREQLLDVAGFKPLMKTLEQNFFRRSELLRCYRIVNDARRTLNRIRFTHLPQIQADERSNAAKLQKFLAFIGGANGNGAVAEELKEFVVSRLKTAEQAASIGKLRSESDAELSELFHQLTEYNEDFGALRQIEEQSNVFSKGELGELYALFGLYGLDLEKRIPPETLNAEYLRDRQLAWQYVEYVSPFRSVRRAAAERAKTRYGLILDEISVAKQTLSFSG